MGGMFIEFHYVYDGSPVYVSLGHIEAWTPEDAPAKGSVLKMASGVTITVKETYQEVTDRIKEAIQS